jgi:hypothetical protein
MRAESNFRFRCYRTPQTDRFALDRRHAANQLGLLQYCQAQGPTGADAITAERNVMARLPPIPAYAPYTQ